MHGKNIMINQPKLNKDNTIIINEAIIPTGFDINKTTNDIYINNKNYTVNHLIKDLQALNETYRSKPCVIRTENGELHKPVIKQVLDDPMNIMQGWEHVIAAIITY